jgi:hypothetical protein
MWTIGASYSKESPVFFYYQCNKCWQILTSERNAKGKWFVAYFLLHQIWPTIYDHKLQLAYMYVPLWRLHAAVDIIMQHFKRSVYSYANRNTSDEIIKPFSLRLYVLLIWTPSRKPHRQVPYEPRQEYYSTLFQKDVPCHGHHSPPDPSSHFESPDCHGEWPPYRLEPLKMNITSCFNVRNTIYYGNRFLLMSYGHPGGGGRPSIPVSLDPRLEPALSIMAIQGMAYIIFMAWEVALRCMLWWEIYSQWLGNQECQ